MMQNANTKQLIVLFFVVLPLLAWFVHDQTQPLTSPPSRDSRKDDPKVSKKTSQIWKDMVVVKWRIRKKESAEQPSYCVEFYLSSGTIKRDLPPGFSPPKSIFSMSSWVTSCFKKPYVSTSQEAVEKVIQNLINPPSPNYKPFKDFHFRLLDQEIASL